MKGEAMLHIPVALERCIALLTPAIEDRQSPIVVDATLGLGGHTRALLNRFPQLNVIGIDRDLDAIAITKPALSEFADRLTIVHAVYDQIPQVLEDLGISGVDGILFDLGVSSMQLDEASRGFSYSQEAPLDMRMDRTAPLTAFDVLHNYSAPDLMKIISRYGEEKFAKSIVSNIMKARESNSLNTTKDLAELVKASIPAPARRTGGNPAKRTFQALRIEVNQELAVLDRAIPAALKELHPGGRMVVMSYQSLEDRIVKSALRDVTESHTPRGLPFDIPGQAPKFTLVFNGSENAPEAEIAENPRSQSLRLRAVERNAA
jgi:16S rRNA (cytosine1402-N4)-methyltransferase